MNNKQFANRIGNIDDRLVQEVGQKRSNQKEYKNMIRKFVSVAAVIALMLVSGAVGAYAFGRETVVEVPVEQETVNFEDIGLTLILPGTWKDQYASETNEFGEYIVYAPGIREACGGETGGMLFCVLRWDEQLTKEQVDNGGEWSFAKCEYIMTTKDGTYLLYYASDVQFTPETEATYRQMESEIKDIRFVPTEVFG